MLERHRVLIVAGETGSGKTTQLPKLCLAAGYGVRGLIGHTQPRRIAARAVSRRIAEELAVPLGAQVGYAVRFSDQTSDGTLIKVLTDGLAAQRDHRRPLAGELRSADHRRSARTQPEHRFPVGLRQSSASAARRSQGHHHQRDDRRRCVCKTLRRRAGRAGQRSWLSGGSGLSPVGSPGRAIRISRFSTTIREVERKPVHGASDILVFLAGEREIHEASKLLRRELRDRYDILPLYARLPAAEQQRIFASGGRRRIVLATNVAETSLTVPNIGFVIDPGFARLSRYSYRSKLQRLPIERMSQASADQRKGRCGRIAPGVCYRLYAEADHLAQPAYTDPEIRRTNLAAVVLQMRAFGLGDIETFPFLDPPEPRAIRDAVTLLTELGACSTIG